MAFPKNKQGYVITRSKSAATYFTASAAYDRPNWVVLQEATIYPTAELAQDAVKKLWRNGSFAAKVVSLQELVGMELEMPDEKPEDKEKMVAAKQDPDAEEELKDPEGDDMDDLEAVDREPELDTDVDADIELDTDIDADIELDMEDQEEDTLLGQHLKTAVGEGKETARQHSAEVAMMGRKRYDMKEAEFKMPTRPGNDPAPPSENKTTVATMTEPKSTMVDFDDPVGEEDKPQTDLDYATSYEHADKALVPAEIKAQLKAVIDDFAAAAEDNNMRDDVRGSFALTAASALQQLLDDLNAGTVEGIKQAQIHMSSYMNPITSHIPPDVAKFIMYGGRKPSLKDYFDTKWEKMRGVK